MHGSINQIMFYLYTKLIGAGFSLSIFALYLLMLSSFDMYSFVETSSHPILWLLFYGYGIICSVLIDGLVRAIPSMKRYSPLLYSIAGCAIFFVIVKDSLEVAWIAGSIGALAAVLFYIGEGFLVKRLKLAWLFALAIPISVAILLTMDFTEKQGWKADRTKTGLQVSFSYFDGMHKIPVQLKKGEKLLFHIESGRIGYSVENKSGDKVPMKQRGEQMMVEAEMKGTYYIVVTGNHVSSGSFEVEWNIK